MSEKRSPVRIVLALVLGTTVVCMALVCIGPMIERQLGRVATPGAYPSRATSTARAARAQTKAIGPTATARRPTPTLAAPTEAFGQGDVLALLAEGKVEVKPKGAGIDEVTLDLRRKVKETLRVNIPAGTFFVCQSSSAQNMVTRRPAYAFLTDDEWKRVTVQAACANLHLDVPGMAESFTIQQAPGQAELYALIAIISDPRYASEVTVVPYTVEQAAVWIVTDDATYDDLGTLVGGFGFGPRLIKEDDAVRAMRLVDAAGIDITTKAIWQDRTSLFHKLTDPALGEWLKDRAAYGRQSPPLVTPGLPTPIPGT